MHTAFRRRSLPAVVSPVGHPLPPGKLASLLPLKHWLLACLCNFSLLLLSVPPYRLCPSFRAQLQPRSPGRRPCPREAIGQPRWRVACIMHRCLCPPVQTLCVLRKRCIQPSFSVRFPTPGSCPCPVKSCLSSTGAWACLSPPHPESFSSLQNV